MMRIDCASNGGIWLVRNPDDGEATQFVALQTDSPYEQRMKTITAERTTAMQR
jgi:hypothetical protein